jgi:hypothetical protein
LPHLYEWVPRIETKGDGVMKRRGPEVAPIGVDRWTNLFRSGDYIGRNLWLRRDGNSPFVVGSPNPAAPADAHEECLGAGAHMGYWRDPEVGGRLLAILRGEPLPAAPSESAARVPAPV